MSGRGPPERWRARRASALIKGPYGPFPDRGRVAMLVMLRKVAMSALLTVLGRLALLTGLVMATTVAVLAFLAAAVLVVLAM
jgi:hypothetical protein